MISFGLPPLGMLQDQPVANSCVLPNHLTKPGTTLSRKTGCDQVIRSSAAKSHVGTCE